MQQISGFVVREAVEASVDGPPPCELPAWCSAPEVGALNADVEIWRVQAKPPLQSGDPVSVPINLGRRAWVLLGRRHLQGPEGGRQPDIELQTPRASRKQALALRNWHGQLFLMDLGSTHGTFLGRERLSPGTPREWRPGMVAVFADNTVESFEYRLTRLKKQKPDWVQLASVWARHEALRGALTGGIPLGVHTLPGASHTGFPPAAINSAASAGQTFAGARQMMQAEFGQKPKGDHVSAAATSCAAMQSESKGQRGADSEGEAVRERMERKRSRSRSPSRTKSRFRGAPDKDDQRRRLEQQKAHEREQEREQELREVHAREDWRRHFERTRQHESDSFQAECQTAQKEEVLEKQLRMALEKEKLEKKRQKRLDKQLAAQRTLQKVVEWEQAEEAKQELQLVSERGQWHTVERPTDVECNHKRRDAPVQGGHKHSEKSLYDQKEGEAEPRHKEKERAQEAQHATPEPGEHKVPRDDHASRKKGLDTGGPQDEHSTIWKEAWREKHPRDKVHAKSAKEKGSRRSKDRNIENRRSASHSSQARKSAKRKAKSSKQRMDKGKERSKERCRSSNKKRRSPEGKFETRHHDGKRRRDSSSQPRAKARKPHKDKDSEKQARKNEDRGRRVDGRKSVKSSNDVQDEVVKKYAALLGDEDELMLLGPSRLVECFKLLIVKNELSSGDFFFTRLKEAYQDAIDQLSDEGRLPDAMAQSRRQERSHSR